MTIEPPKIYTIITDDGPISSPDFIWIKSELLSMHDYVEYGYSKFKDGSALFRLLGNDGDFFSVLVHAHELKGSMLHIGEFATRCMEAQMADLKARIEKLKGEAK